MHHPGRLENSFKLAGRPLHSPSVQRSDQAAVHGSSLAEGGFAGKLLQRFAIRVQFDTQPLFIKGCNTVVTEALLQEAI
jgi:hypothetical protein